MNERRKIKSSIYSKRKKIITPRVVIIFIILLLSLILRLYYYNYTHYYVRQHDVPGHMDYIKYIAENDKLPVKNQCWQCYHPPIYFLVASGIYEAGMEITGNETATFRGLQVWSILFYMGFLIFASMILNKFIKNKIAFYISVALLCFWPSSIIHSARIGNDTFMYMLYAAAFYFLIRWYNDKDDKSLYIFALTALLATFTKSNGIILMGIFGALAVINWLREKRKTLYVAKIFPPISILIFGLAVGLSKYLTLFFEKKDVDILAGNSAGLPNTLFVSNKFINYIFFDFKIFLTKPFTHPFSDGFGRQYFWNYIYKTGLFGEFTIETAIHPILATMISIVFLVLLGFIIVGIVAGFRKKSLTDMPVFINMVLLFAAIIVFRVKIPASCSTDFRYILPVLISWPIFFARGCLFFKEKKLEILEYAGYGLAGAFILLSVLFIIIKM